MNITDALCGPSPNTVCVPVFQRLLDLEAARRLVAARTVRDCRHIDRLAARDRGLALKLEDALFGVPDLIACAAASRGVGDGAQRPLVRRLWITHACSLTRSTGT